MVYHNDHSKPSGRPSGDCSTFPRPPPLSSRHVEELLEERGVELDHATVHDVAPVGVAGPHVGDVGEPLK